MPSSMLLGAFLIGAVSFAVPSAASALSTRDDSAPAFSCIRSNPKPKTTYCHFRGTLTSPGPILVGPTTESDGYTFDQCQAACFADSACRSFTYSSPDQVCTTYKQTVVRQSPKRDSKSSTNIYSRSCFIGYSSAAAVGTFEDQTLSPFKDSLGDNTQNPKVTSGGADDSDYSVLFNVNHHLPFQYNSYSYIGDDSVFLCKGVTYVLSYSVYQVPGGTSVPDGTTDPEDQPLFYTRLLDPRGYVAFQTQTNPLSNDSFVAYEQNGNTIQTPAGQWLDVTWGTFTAKRSGQFALYFNIQAAENTLMQLKVDNIMFVAQTAH